MQVYSVIDDKEEYEELLNPIIDLIERSLSLPTQSARNNGAHQTTLAMAYHARYLITKRRVDLETAIDSAGTVYKETQIHDKVSLYQKLF